tara:strand:+ start:363 stop:563 length:201 start_codon:yes stop_codon:yes gene_type:complete
MKLKMQEVYKNIIYSDHNDVELDQLIIGILGSRMNIEDWHNVSETVSSYKLDDQMELDFEPEDNLR